MNNLINKIKQVNEIGRQNLAEKGIALEEGATTYSIMQEILNLGFNGKITKYNSIVYKDNNILTFIDEDNEEKDIKLIYEDDKVVGIKFEENEVDIIWDNDTVVSVGETTLDLDNAPELDFADFAVKYKSITYNNDNTVTLIDKDDNEATMNCVYTDGKLTELTLDGQNVALEYDGDVLVGVGQTIVDLGNVPEPTSAPTELN